MSFAFLLSVGIVAVSFAVRCRIVCRLLSCHLLFVPAWALAGLVFIAALFAASFAVHCRFDAASLPCRLLFVGASLPCCFVYCSMPLYLLIACLSFAIYCRVVWCSLPCRFLFNAASSTALPLNFKTKKELLTY